MTEVTEVRERALAAKAVARKLAALTAEPKDRALQAIAEELLRCQDAILAANAADVAEAEALVAEGRMARSLLDRLRLSPEKLAAMAEGVRAVAALPDPSGRVLERTLLDDGLELRRVTRPLGLLGVIFESRPDAVTQISALAIKSGNAVLLKGGREAARSTGALVEAIHTALDTVPEIPRQAVATLAGRAEVDELLSLEGVVDLVIPRGGNDLVRYVQEHTRIPVLGHAEGVCHVYVDAAADPEMAIAIVLDAKLTYPAACNAVETVLVHSAAAPDVLRPLLGRLLESGVEVRGCPETLALCPGFTLTAATEEDWRTEYGAPILSVKLVDSLGEAIAHINGFGSSHTDAIVTGDPAAARRFLDEVDSAGVYHNASTRFADGFRYGLGAEVGISTSKLHARGPVGLDGLVTYRWELHGSGQVTAAYGPGGRPFKHQKLT